MKLVVLLYLVALVHGKHIVEAIPLYKMMRPVFKGKPEAVQAIKEAIKSESLSFASFMSKTDVQLFAAMLRGEKAAYGVRFEITRVEGEIKGDIVIPGIDRP